MLRIAAVFRRAERGGTSRSGPEPSRAPLPSHALRLVFDTAAIRPPFARGFKSLRKMRPSVALRGLIQKIVRFLIFSVEEPQAKSRLKYQHEPVEPKSRRYAHCVSIAFGADLRDRGGNNPGLSRLPLAPS